MIEIIAWISIILSLFAVLITPLVIGAPRNPYNYSDFLGKILEFVMILLISGRVFEWW